MIGLDLWLSTLEALVMNSRHSIRLQYRGNNELELLFRASVSTIVPIWNSLVISLHDRSQWNCNGKAGRTHIWLQST